MRRTISTLFLIGISFAYVEAAVVVYLRTIYEPLHRHLAASQPGDDIFPLLDLQQLQTEAPQAARLLPMELVREAATLLMLGGVALAAAASRTKILPCLAIVFGIWDLFFYVWLKLLIDWPASLLTWDLLFLIPVPWAAPVLAPVLVSLSLIGCGLAALRRTPPMRWVHWAGIVLGCAIILLSFTLDFPNLIAGKVPGAFPWPMFTAGALLGLGAFVHALRPPRPLTEPRPSGSGATPAR